MKRFWKSLRQYLVLRRQRKQLLMMDERTRRDLAISRVDAEQLAGRYGVLANMENSERAKSWKR